MIVLFQLLDDELTVLAIWWNILFVQEF